MTEHSKLGPVLVTGAGGLLGGCVSRALAASGYRVEPLTHDRLDVADPDAVRAVVLGLRPSAVIHCAAMTDVDGCERDPDLAAEVNARAPGHIARAAGEAGADVVYVSTDYVFDGTKGAPYTEDDTPNPIQVYGRTKLEGEDAVRAATERSYIVRSAFIYGVGGKNFVSRVLGIVRESGRVKVVDQTGSPTYAPDLAVAVVSLLGSSRYGTYHVANAGRCGFSELVRVALDAAGVHAMVEDVAAASLGRAARRPSDTTLDVGKWAAAGFTPLRGWPEAVHEFAAAESASTPAR